MIFNSKFAATPILTNQKLIQPLAKIINGQAEEIIRRFQEIGDVILPTEKKYSQPFLTLLPKYKGQYFFGKTIGETVDLMRQKTANVPVIRNAIGLLYKGEFDNQTSNYPMQHWFKTGLLMTRGIINNKNLGIITLDGYEEANQLYDFVQHTIRFEHPGYYWPAVNPMTDGVVIFGAYNPFYYYLSSLLEEIKNNL